jgi:hypothetical protein
LAGRAFPFYIAPQGNGGSRVEEDGRGNVKALAEARDVTAVELAFASQDERG